MRQTFIGFLLFISGCNQVSGVNDFSFDTDNQQINNNSDNGVVNDQTVDPFQGMDCNNTDQATCDYNVCQYKAAVDELKISCDAATEDVEYQNYCDAYLTCYSTFVSCFTTACPTGGILANVDQNAVLTCTNNFNDCVAPLNKPSNDTDLAGDIGSQDEVPDPFAELDCSTNDTESCDYVPCQYQSAVDSMKQARSAVSGADRQYYDDMITCYADYVSCFTPVCPSGGVYMEGDIDGILACTDQLNACVSGDTTETPTDNENPQDTDNPQDEVPDPFAELDCSTNNTESCDYVPCQYQSAVDSMKQARSAVSGADRQYYDDMITCYADYVSCFTPVCPSGGIYMDGDIDGILACTNELNACVSG